MPRYHQPETDLYGTSGLLGLVLGLLMMIALGLIISHTDALTHLIRIGRLSPVNLPVVGSSSAASSNLSNSPASTVP